MGVGYGLGGMIPISVLINRWFTKLYAAASGGMIFSVILFITYRRAEMKEEF